MIFGNISKRILKATAQYIWYADWINRGSHLHATHLGMNFANVTEEQGQRVIKILENWIGSRIFGARSVNGIHGRLAIKSRHHYSLFLVYGTSYLRQKKNMVQDPVGTRPSLISRG